MKPFLSDASEIDVLNKKNLPLQKLRVFQIFYCSASVGPMFSFCSYSFALACSLFKMSSHYFQERITYLYQQLFKLMDNYEYSQINMFCTVQRLQIILINLGYYSAITISLYLRSTKYGTIRSMWSCSCTCTCNSPNLQELRLFYPLHPFLSSMNIFLGC